MITIVILSSLLIVSLIFVGIKIAIIKAKNEKHLDDDNNDKTIKKCIAMFPPNQSFPNNEKLFRKKCWSPLIYEKLKDGFQPICTPHCITTSEPNDIPTLNYKKLPKEYGDGSKVVVGPSKDPWRKPNYKCFPNCIDYHDLIGSEIS